MTTITIEQIAIKLGITKASLVSRIKYFYKEDWPIACGKDSNSFLFDEDLIIKCLEDKPYDRKPGGQYLNSNRMGKKNRPKIKVTLNPDYIKFLAGRKEDRDFINFLIERKRNEETV